MTYSILAGSSLLLLLLLSTITDIRRREIPVGMCLLFSTVITLLHLIFSHSISTLLLHALAGALLFTLYLVNALFFHGGGGDCILVFCIGFALGLLPGLFVALLSCSAMTLYHLLTPRKQEQYPMAPAMLLGAVLYFIFSGGLR